MKKRGWTGLGRGHLWEVPEVRAKLLAKRKRPLDQRLAKFQISRGDDECWGWSGCDNGVGYGYLRIDKKLRLATHVALELDGRPRPSDAHSACHHCDNPPCTNPKHLFWGTHQENMQDCARKGRVYRNTALRTHCRRGHEFRPETTIVDRRTGQRKCRVCHNLRARQRDALKVQA